MTRLLAFDTSTERMSIALVQPGATLLHEGEGGAQASARLIPEILALLARGDCRLADLDAIAFGRGPGAFTGLRTACSVAQGLGLGGGKPVLPVDSLLLVAQDALDAFASPPPALDAWVVMDARMDEIYAAHYRFAAGRWQVLDAPELCRVEALNERWAGRAPELVAGSALAVFGERLRCGEAQRVPATCSRAAALARLAEGLWRDGAAVDAALALPVYLRDKVAQTSAERKAARTAASVAP